MKNKAVTYVLIVAVALVWGTITYRVIAAVNNDDDEGVTATSVVSKTSHEDYSEKPDTAHLLLNYPDPFTGVQHPAKDTTVAAVHKSSVVAVTALRPIANPPVINLNFIKYAGFIKNAGSKKLIAILVINGRNVSLQEGESADHVHLLKNLRDSVRISYNGHTQFITLDSNAP